MGRYSRQHIIQLVVDKDSLAQLLVDLNDTRDILSDQWEHGFDIRMRPARMEGGEPNPELFVVTLDKYQRAYLESKMTVQAWANKYGGVKNG